MALAEAHELPVHQLGQPRSVDRPHGYPLPRFAESTAPVASLDGPRPQARVAARSAARADRRAGAAFIGSSAGHRHRIAARLDGRHRLGHRSPPDVGRDRVRRRPVVRASRLGRTSSRIQREAASVDGVVRPVRALEEDPDRGGGFVAAGSPRGDPREPLDRRPRRPGGLVRLATIPSERLRTIIRHMDLRSRNFWAEVLGKRLGFDESGHGTIGAAARAIHRFTDRHGQDFTLYDSSGLSYANRVTAKGILELLWVADRKTWGPVLRRSLPAGGQGTLEDRLRDVTIHAKPGTLHDASAL